nr:MAG TPA: tail protein [Caudoviricetes sp.]
MIKVKDINGSTIKLEVRSFSYQGNFMGESYISFDVNSPVYINFEIGDYIEYRGERFVLNYIPSPIKNGTPGKSGDAFVYRDVKFNSLADELTRCDFLDVVLADNHVHFTSLSKFSFYAATVKDLADRIQANLNRLYNGGEAWTVTVEEDVAVKDKSLSVDNINCWEALSLVNSDFDANFVISGRTIRIGTAGISVGTVFGYGKGNGLINIEQSTNNDSLIVTRLRAYGSTRNIPYRYYNNLKDSNGTPLIPESMYVNTLMLPGFAENGGDAYVDSPNITRIGIREKSVYFDGSGGLPEIYPSIEGMTAEELKAAGINVNATGRIDEIVSAEQMTDDGIVPEDKEELDKKTFTITLKDIGFNPVDKKHLTTETPFISMKTGMCGGREFEITGCEEKGNNYILTCNREMDSSINKAFPNNPYQVSAGDQFVFIGIAMDDIYIKAAEQRLLAAAKDYLSNNDKSKYTYLPKIDKVFMARHPEIASSLKEGNILDFKDTDLGIDVSVIIQSLVIKEGGPVPEYEITLFNDKVVSTIEKIQNSITSLASNTGITIEQAKSLFATWVEAWRVKWFDQKLHTYDPVEFNSVTSNEDNWHITDKGDAKFRDVIGKVITITDRLMTDNFVAGMTGTGVGVVNKAEVHMDKGVIRKYLEVLALVVAQIFYRGGRQVLSPAGMKINKVEEFDGYWRCYMETEDGQVNEFTVGAQARCNRYGSQQRYWWRLVDNIGVDYIDVSKTDMDAGSMAPAVGDEVVQFGHRTDPYLQWVVMDSSFSDDAGRTIYAGVNSYDLSGKWVLREGVSPTDPSRIGLFTRHGEFSDVIDGINQDIQDNQQAIQDTKDAADAIQSVVDNLTGIIIPDMQNQLDGAIQSWDGEVEPTLNNYPANEWFDEETGRDERAKHVGDTYIYYTTDSEGNTVSSRYNFRFVDGVYKWELIADSVSAELEVKLRELTGTVGKKNSITYSNNVPTPAYNIDDLWIKEDGSMYICRAQKMEGMQGSAADWELFNDTMLRLVQIASDNVISVEEKPSLRDTWSQIQKEFTKYQADATTYGVSITNLQNAYNALGSFLTNTVKLAQDVDTSLTVSQKADYNQKFADYYSRRTEFSNIVSQKIADESVGNLKIGMVNLLKGSNVELGAQSYLLGAYYYDNVPEIGKKYTIVVCYTLGEDVDSINFFEDNGYYKSGEFNTKGDKIIESRVFNYRSPNNKGYSTFYQLPNGAYGSKVHWAVLVEGNKGPNSWIPSQADNDAKAQAIAKAEAELAETKANAYADGIVTEAEQNAINEAQARLDALKIGSVNLVSRKMMLNWNNKKDGIAVWGQDSDGIYLGINQGALYTYVCGGTAHNDLFGGTIKYKDNTQYVFQVKWKLAGEQTNNNSGVSFWALYTDGTSDGIRLGSLQTSLIVESLITKKGKTVEKIFSSYGENVYRSLIYSLALYEGNKVLAEPPVATEDLQGQSNVNLVDGGKEVTVTVTVGDNYAARLLVVPVLKPNTVYHVSFKAKNLAGSPPYYTAALYDKNISVKYFRLDSVSGGIMITPNNFTEGEATLLLYAGVAGSTNGNSVKYTEVMLVEGFTPPSSYSPSPGDVAKDIKDAIAKTVDITAPSQVFKYGPGYTGTPTPSSIVLTATPRNFTPTSYQWQFLNGSTWINITIDGASSTYSVNPNSTTLFPSGTNVRTFRCICNGDEKLSDSFTIAKLADGATGSKGDKGDKGDTGTAGKGIKSITNYYLASASSSGVTVSTSGWTTTIQTISTSKRYLWNYEVVTYTDNSTTTTTPVIIGVYGNTGATGSTGAAGRGITSITEYYAVSSSNTTAPTSWSTTVPTTTTTNKYLWNYEKITYTDSTTEETTKRVIGTHGATGSTGAAGKDAYTVLLGNESHAFAGSTAAALAGSTTCSVVAYKGATRVAATIGTISGLPTGMTASVASNGTTTPVITFTVTTSMTTASGTVNIPVTVDGKTFTKVFSYSIAFRGDPGESINGKMLYKDPEFKKGLNNVYKYTNSSNVDPDYIASKLTVERVTKPSDAPTQSGYCLKVTCKAAQAPGYGGVHQSITSRANAVFVQKIIAKIPVGYKINTASNSMGTGYTDTWLTPTEGTGKYTTYLRKVVCGTTGNFSSGGHVYITGSPAPTESAPLEWYIAYMTAFDLTADGYGDIESVTKDDFASQLGFADFDDLVANAITKGPLIKAGMINTVLLSAESLVAVDGFIDKLSTNILKAGSITANMISVGGFEFQNGQIYGGSDFGVGPGVKITSKDTERSFKAYKDSNNYISMFYNSANDWGLKGVVGGSTVFQLGNPAGKGTFVGPFNFTKTQLVSSSDVTIGSSNYKQGFTLENNKISFNRAVSSIYQRRVEMGVANTAYGSDTLLAVEGGDIWHQGTVTTPSGSGYTSRSCRFYASDIMMRGSMMMYNGSNIVLESSDANAFVRVPCVSKYCKPATDIRLDLDQTVVSFTYTSKINVQLPKNPKFGHTVIFLAGRKADLGIIGGDISNEKILNPGNNTIYNWCNISNRNIVIRCVFMDPWWHLSYDDVVNSGFGN